MITFRRLTSPLWVPALVLYLGARLTWDAGCTIVREVLNNDR